jgi:hypothetical protein
MIITTKNFTITINSKEMQEKILDLIASPKPEVTFGSGYNIDENGNLTTSSLPDILASDFTCLKKPHMSQAEMLACKGCVAYQQNQSKVLYPKERK